MCYYITTAIPARTDPELLRSVLKKHGIGFESVRNDHVEKQLPAGMTYLEKRSDHCDCGTVIGFISQRGEDDLVVEKERRKLRKKGWGKTKINRVIDEKHRAAQQRARNANILASDRVAEAEKWIALIRDLLTDGGLDCFGLLLHWYDTSPGVERIDLERTVRISASEIDPDYIMRIEEDVLYLFTPV